jgi:hypothetical protein
VLMMVGDHDVGDPKGALKRAAIHDLELHALLHAMINLKAACSRRLCLLYAA